MDVPVGVSVLVNVAAFTASPFRRREAIACDVLEEDADRLLIRTRFPYRVFTMWVSRVWIDGVTGVTETVSGRVESLR